jgi:hypothetical protein
MSWSLLRCGRVFIDSGQVRSLSEFHLPGSCGDRRLNGQRMPCWPGCAPDLNRSLLPLPQTVKSPPNPMLHCRRESSVKRSQSGSHRTYQTGPGCQYQSNQPAARPTGGCGPAICLKRTSTSPPVSLRRCEVLVASGKMPTCPYCPESLVTRDGHDRHDRQRDTCADCGRDFTLRSASAYAVRRYHVGLGALDVFGHHA